MDIQCVISPQCSGFLLHIIVETPAILGFIFFPSATLQAKQAHAHPVIRQYGLLLLASSLIASSVLNCEAPTGTIPYGNLQRRIAGALALYHVGPVLRATVRLFRNENQGGAFGSPVLHLVSHACCFTLLLWIYVSQ